MRRTKIFISAFLIIITVACSQGIQNLSFSKQQIVDYYERGQYHKELISIVNDALEKLNEISLPNNPAIVFDIDETVLSNYDYIKSIDFGFELDAWNDWMREAKCKSIDEVKEIYNWAVKHNVKVVFITGRHDDVYQETYRNLLLQGYTEIDTVICRKPSELKIKAKDFKEVKREELTKKGYNIIACIGDQDSDVSGKFTGLKIKLPNYLYHIK